MTNSEFAKAVGCDVTTASRYRNGHRLPGVQLLERIRLVLGVSHDELHAIWEKGTKWKAEHPKDPQGNPFGAYLRRTMFDDEAAA